MPQMQLLGDPPTFPAIPASRVYIHVRCRSGTSISGFDFIRRSPGGRTPTICAKCRCPFPLREFIWEDTGEQVTAYLDQLETLLPAPYREAKRKMMHVAWSVCLMGGLLGMPIGYGAEKSAVSVFCGALVGLFVGIIIGGMMGSKMYPAEIEFRKYI